MQSYFIKFIGGSLLCLTNLISVNAQIIIHTGSLGLAPNPNFNLLACPAPEPPRANASATATINTAKKSINIVFPTATTAGTTYNWYLYRAGIGTKSGTGGSTGFIMLEGTTFQITQSTNSSVCGQTDGYSYSYKLVNGVLVQNIVILNRTMLNQSDVSTENVISDATNLIYPNPTTGLITIQHDSNTQTVQVLDMTGKLLLSQYTNNATQTEIDLSELAAGMYMVRTDGQTPQKVVKQ